MRGKKLSTIADIGACSLDVVAVSLLDRRDQTRMEKPMGVKVPILKYTKLSLFLSLCLPIVLCCLYSAYLCVLVAKFVITIAIIAVAPCLNEKQLARCVMVIAALGAVQKAYVLGAPND